MSVTVLCDQCSDTIQQAGPLDGMMAPLSALPRPPLQVTNRNGYSDAIDLCSYRCMEEWARENAR